MNFEFVEYSDGAPVRSFVSGLDAFGLHWHREVELLLVLDGTCEITCDGSVSRVGRGDIILVNSNAIHGFADGDGSYANLCIQFSPHVWALEYGSTTSFTFDCNSTNEPDGKNSSRYRRLARLCAVLGWENYRRRDGYQYAVRAALNAIAMCLFRFFRYQRIDMTVGNSSTADDRVRLRRVLDYAASTYTRGETIAEAASNLGLSESLLCHFFQGQTGTGFGSYVRGLRVNRAQELLRTTDLPLHDVIADSGFSSAASFHRAFRHHTRMTPNQYRRSRVQSRSSLSMGPYRTFNDAASLELLGGVAANMDLDACLDSPPDVQL